MKNREVSSKALAAWVATAMLGPAALVSARSSWICVLVATILCGILCVVIYNFSGGNVWKNKVFCCIAVIWCIYAAAIVSAQGSIVWPGRGAQVVVPLVLIVLAALSSCHGADRASSVAATICPLCIIIFAVVLACGVGNIQWQRVTASYTAPNGMLLFVLLLPVVATAIPRCAGTKIAAPLFGVAVFALVLSVAAIGTLSLPVALTRDDAFFEFSKSLDLFSTVQRFESITAVAVTLSVYAMVSLLFSGIYTMAQNVIPVGGKWAVLCAAGISAGIVVAKLWIHTGLLVIVTVLLWGILTIFFQTFFREKKAKKHENNP